MRFNLPFRKAKTVLNHEGAAAYTLTPQLELYAAVATAALSDQFYEKADTRLQRLRELVARNDPEFVARLAVYAREQLYLRTVPLVLTVELARLHRGDSLVSRLVARVVQRADEITELLAYYARAKEREGVKTLNRLSKQVQKGLALSFNRFDGYQLAKYDRAGQVRLRDALFLVHPTPGTLSSRPCSTSSCTTRCPRPTPGKLSCRQWVSKPLPRRRSARQLFAPCGKP
ncbi:TROVE domain-containing protein [Hymenobacter cellulosilyticus]|uniref:TROVE domain-containing protein n=1 Tax=Hymenobacter cellulosilyticus TaxID=2932248 RepID=A0A8T9Q8Y1_9BACT|nr:TROVE domain-containing protein [Hymenobacter cellulosilyticus]UOQ71443.1 TROVE domain-containing protein [Hymenobacter cellulosilyticus]